MKKRWIFIILAISLLVVLGFIFVKINYFSGGEGFSVNKILIKLNIGQGNSASTNVKITDTEMLRRDFQVYFNKLENLASVDADSFSLNPGDSKTLKVSFQDTKREVGVYTGQLVIHAFDSTKKIPIIVGVEDMNPSFAIIQSAMPKYETVYSGGKFGIEIKVFDLIYVSSPNVRVKYSIKDFNDEVIWSDQEDLILGESMNKIINLPDVAVGDYVFITEIDYSNTKSISSYFFNIVKKEIIPYESSNFLILIISFFVVGSLILIFYFIKRSDDLLVRLQKQQNNELRSNLVLLDKCQISVRKLRNSKKKMKELKHLRRKIIRKIKHKHKIQKLQLKKMKRKMKKDELHKKLDTWKKHGFKMIEADEEMKKHGSNIHQQLNDFKKQGYKLPGS